MLLDDVTAIRFTSVHIGWNGSGELHVCGMRQAAGSVPERLGVTLEQSGHGGVMLFGVRLEKIDFFNWQFNDQLSSWHIHSLSPNAPGFKKRKREVKRLGIPSQEMANYKGAVKALQR
jgi:hypothetical protein